MASEAAPSPARPERTKVPVLGLFVVFCVVVVPLALIGPGVWLLYQRSWGTKVEGTVLGCETHLSGRYVEQDCAAAWAIDGKRVVGPIEGSGDFEVGRTTTLTVRGGTAYSRSLGLPLLLIGLGLPFTIVPGRWAVQLACKLRARRRPAA